METVKNKPTDATHYDNEIKKYLKLDGGILHVWVDSLSIWNPIPIIFMDIERCTVL